MAPKNGPIIAAVAFDGRQQAVLTTALSLGKVLDVPVELLHVVEPSDFRDAPFPPGMTDTTSLFRSAKAAERVQRIVATARQSLEALGASCAGHGVAVTTKVIAGSARDVLETETVGQHATLLVIGYRVADAPAVVAHPTTARGLMHDAPVPVLAVPAGVPFDAGRGGLRLLLADDGRDASRDAVRCAYGLAARLRDASLCHLHVLGRGERVTAAASDFRRWQRLDDDSEGAVEALCLEEDETYAEALRRRGGAALAAATAAGAGLTVALREGRVEEQLLTAVREMTPDLVVYGPHKPLHASSSWLGRMPFNAMLRSGRPSLVVPPHSTLMAPFAD